MALVEVVEAVDTAEVAALVVVPITQQLTRLPPPPMLPYLKRRFDALRLLSPVFAWEILLLAVLFLSMRTTVMVFSIGRWTRTVRTMPLTTMRNLH